ncbi:heavy-metal-associated domain-containing protein [Desulfolucanica intricata]|uniref:heavy-metal-associated domain-containing protein n=1 Tax=Desulfolucanica intricata TaxID=1285191 RepID=UPI00082F14E8|nr:heavy metal-associated domain-containing protein [Desulfolucanica intricata]
MEKITFRLGDLACPDCAQKMGQILEKQKGIYQANVVYTTGKVKIQYDPNQINLQEIEKIIAKTGYRILEKR